MDSFRYYFPTSHSSNRTIKPTHMDFKQIDEMCDLLNLARAQKDISVLDAHPQKEWLRKLYNEMDGTKGHFQSNEIEARYSKDEIPPAITFRY